MSAEPQYAVVTGAASGLGRAIALRLAREGWTLALCDIQAEQLDETARQAAEQGGAAETHQLDVADPAGWQALYDDLRARWPRLHLLVNNAGVSSGGDFDACSLDDWNWLLSINLHGVVLGCRTFIPWLKENPGRAHLINTASLAGLMSAPGMSAYNVAKAGVVALSETLYAELMPQGVGVTVLCPGFFQTNLLESGRFSSQASRRVGQQYMESSRFTADDVARLALRAMKRRQLYVVHGARARALWRFKRFHPASFHRLMVRIYARMMRQEG